MLDIQYAVIDTALPHSEFCFEWDKCDDCWEDEIAKVVSLFATEPVDAEMVGRSTLQDNPMYAGYSPADRKFQLLDMSEDLGDLANEWATEELRIRMVLTASSGSTSHTGDHS